MPRKTDTAADKAYNIRRRAKRTLRRLERDLSKMTSRRDIATTKSYMAQLERSISESYTRGKFKSDTDTAQRASQVLKAILPQGRVSTKERRRTAMFQREINLASMGQDTALGSHGKEYAKVFYRATQQHWQGLPMEARNAAIMSALGAKDLGEAFEMVMAENRDAVRAIVRSKATVDDTELPEFYQEDVPDIITSPDYLDYVKMI